MRNCLLPFLIVINNLINSQEVKLIEFNNWRDYSKNCNLISNCVDFASLKNDTLLIFITTRNLKYKSQPILSYTIESDTLKIDFGPVPIIRDTVIFNTKSQSFDTVKSIRMLFIPTTSFMDQSCRTLLLKFAGFKTFPNCYIYNGGIITNCPVTYINYKLHNGDTINIINKNGFKDGTWLEFYENGQIRKRKTYKNGQFIEGNLYNILGEKTHIVTENGIEMAIPIDLDK